MNPASMTLEVEMAEGKKNNHLKVIGDHRR
jgi:hypothetical protein